MKLKTATYFSIFFVFIILVFLLFFNNNYSKSEENHSNIFNFETVTHFTSETYQSIKIIKESESNLCLLYIWNGLGNGGPATASIPCLSSEIYSQPFSNRFEVIDNSYSILEDKKTTTHIFRDKKYKDSCYIYFWKGMGNGGPALASINCNKISLE